MSMGTHSFFIFAVNVGHLKIVFILILIAWLGVKKIFYKEYAVFRCHLIDN